MRLNISTLNSSKDHYLATIPLISFLNDILDNEDMKDFIISKAKECDGCQINNEYELICNFAELLSSDKYTGLLDEFKVRFGSPTAERVDLMIKEAKAHKRYFSFLSQSMFSTNQKDSHVLFTHKSREDLLTFIDENAPDSIPAISSFIAKTTKIDTDVLRGNPPYNYGVSTDGYYNSDIAIPLLSSAIPALSIILQLPADTLYSSALAPDIKSPKDILSNFHRIVTDEAYKPYRDSILSTSSSINDSVSRQLQECLDIYSSLPQTTQSKLSFLLYDLQNNDKLKNYLIELSKDHFRERLASEQRPPSEHLISLSNLLSTDIPPLEKQSEYIEVDGQRFSIEKILSSGGASYKNYIVKSEEGEKFIVKVNTVFQRSELSINADQDYFYKHCHVQTIDGIKQAMFMRPAKGKDLNSLIIDSNLDSNFAEQSKKRLDYIIEALEGMVRFHRAGLLHGDTLPANLFYDDSAPEGRKVNFIDFDEAEFASSLTPEEIRDKKVADINRLADGLAKISGSFDYDEDLQPIDGILDDLKNGSITMLDAIARIKSIATAIEAKDFSAIQRRANSGELYSKGRFIDNSTELGGVSFTLMDKSVVDSSCSSDTDLTSICMPFYDFLKPDPRTFLPVVGTVKHVIDGREYQSLILKYNDSGKDIYLVKTNNIPFTVSSEEEYESLSKESRFLLAKVMASAQQKIQEVLGRASSSTITPEISCASHTIREATTLHSSMLGKKIYDLGRRGADLQFNGRSLDQIGGLGHPPLILASEYQQDDLVVELIKAGADPEVKNKYGYSFYDLRLNEERRSRFYAAIAERKKEVKEIIISKMFNLDPDSPTEISDAIIQTYGSEVLKEAIINGNNEIVRHIVRPPFSIATEELLKLAESANNNYAATHIAKAITYNTILKYADTDKDTVLHASLEYVHGVGGLKEASTGLISALNQKGNFAVSAVTPYWDFLDKDEKFKRDTVLLGKVKHVYKGKVVESEIYGHLTEFPPGSGQKTVQYLIRPSHGSPVGRIFDIGDPKLIYSAFEHSEPQNRLEYYNGAMASFMKIDNAFSPSFKAFHSHGWHSALANKVMINFDDYKSKVIGEHDERDTPKLFHTIHMLTKDDLGSLQSDSCFTSMGLRTHDTRVELQKEALLHSDMVNHVSRKMVDWVLMDDEKSCGYLNIFKKLHEDGRMHGITNGINTATFSPSNPKNLDGKPMAITYGEEDDILAKRQESKDYLKSLLNDKDPEMSARFDPEKPMLMYVGRYAKEKGIDALRAAALKAKSIGMQFVAMGIIAAGDEGSRAVIDALKSDPELKDHIIVLDEWIGETNQKSLGKYFRQAADFTLVPSHSETCGLVPMESLQCGSIPITSNVQGLPDVISEINCPTAATVPADSTENGFIYDEHNPDEVDERTAAMEAAIQKAYDFHTGSITDKVSYNALLQKYMKRSKDFSWDISAANGYESLYREGLSKAFEYLYLEEEYVYSPLPDPAPDPGPIIIRPERPSPTGSLPLNVMHCSLEYGSNATLGGLGTVVTQLCNQQSVDGGDVSVITPLYPINDEADKEEVAIVKHLYEGTEAEAKIYKKTHANGVTQYYVEPCHYMHQELFNVTDKLRIYQTGGSNKTKYFDSAVSAFLNSASLEDKPQILQTHGWQTGLTARFLREREGNTDIKIINTIHVGNIDCGGPKPREFYSGTGLISARTVYGALDSLNYSDKSVTVSSGLIEDLTSLKGLHPDIAFVYTCNKHKLFPILNGIDHRKYDPRSIPTFDPANPKASKEVIRKELFARGGDIVGTRSAWSMAPDLPVILFVGRFSPEKGTAEFAEAARICQGKANLVFMGRGLDAEMNEFIKTPRNNVLVVLTERDQQLLGPRLRACADIQFVPSYSEACGLVAMEGQATGALTVASNIGGLPDIVKDLRVSADGGTGFLYEPGDSGSLAEALENAVRMINSSDAESIVSRVYLDSREYDWQVTSRKYSSLYGSLVELAPLMMTPVDSSTRVSELPSSRRLDI